MKKDLQKKRFKKNKENFVCEKCGSFVKGDGFTDHCPECLWSKHVDIYPGDRGASCQGMMEPVGVKREGERYFIYYRCQECGYKHRVKKVTGDNMEEVVRLSTEKL